jgi:anti-sigma regulatory factor (Ser/Thr protein kinase)
LALQNDHISFEILDDALYLSPEHRLEYFNKREFTEIGPLIEYALFNSVEFIEFSANVTKKSLPTDLRDLLAIPEINRQPLRTNPQPSAIEFSRCPLTPEHVDDPRWQMFCRRLKSAAVSAGFRTEFAAALTGTIDELAGNVAEHSKCATSGVVGYRWNENEFEMCIGDGGIGVLASLRSNSDYAYILDSGQAMETMIIDGESSRGRLQGNGMGFHQLIHNIASENSLIRFRSGDHLLAIDGLRTPPIREIAQRVDHVGLVITILSRIEKKQLQLF